MSQLERTINSIRPRLREIAPQTYWISLAFAFFNIFVGYAAANSIILYRLQLLGTIPIKVWGVIFFTHGVLLLFSLLLNSWRTTRGLHMVGIAINGSWLFESLAAWLAGQSPFSFLVWVFLTTTQIIIYHYFAPRIGNAK